MKNMEEEVSRGEQRRRRKRWANNQQFYMQMGEFGKKKVAQNEEVEVWNFNEEEKILTSTIPSPPSEANMDQNSRQDDQHLPREDPQQAEDALPKSPQPKALPPPAEDVQPLSAECFVVSRGWQLDQSRLLRALDRCAPRATFGRVHVAPTMGRLSDSVRARLDAVVVHLGSNDLADAAKASGRAGAAATMATVASRQILRAAGQNRGTLFLVSLPLPSAAGQRGASAAYDNMHQTFCSTLRANCSSAEAANVRCVDNDNLAGDDKYYEDNAVSSSEPSFLLTSAGTRRLAKNWEEHLRRVRRTPEGAVYAPASSSDSGSSCRR